MANKKQKHPRTYARNRAASVSRRGYEKVFETDGTYLLKLVIVMLLGTFWLRFHQAFTWLGIPFSALPVGMLIGLLLVRKFENYQTDRKLWYAILILVTIICYFTPSGVMI